MRILMPQASTNSSRIVELDGLRGIAALAVLYFHYTTQFNKFFGYTDTIWWPAHQNPFGLPIFFMLSGYFIAKAIEDGIRPSDFAVSRFSRLFPVYWPCVLITFFIVHAGNLSPYEVRFHQLLVNMTMVQEFFRVPHVDGAYWALTVEISFYIWMLALCASGRFQRFEFFLAPWLVAVLFWGWKDFLLPDFHLKHRIVKFLLLGTGHLFGAGIIAYRVRIHGWTIFRAILLAACVAIPWIIPGYRGRFSTSCAMVLVLVSVLKTLPMFRWRPLVFIGTISYPLYLLHQYIGYVIIRHLTSSGINANICIPVTICMMIPPAWILTRYVERPAIRLIRSHYTAWRQKPRASTVRQD